MIVHPLLIQTVSLLRLLYGRLKIKIMIREPLTYLTQWERCFAIKTVRKMTCSYT